MVDYITASRTKDYFEAQLLRDHPEIVSIAPQLKLDEHGFATKEGIIVIGVVSRKLSPLGEGESTSSSPIPIPSSLPAVDEKGAVQEGEEVTVVVEETGEVVPHMNVARMRPCPGGFSVGHTLVTAGTFGGNVRFGANFGFILSCNHVLANSNAGAVGDPVIQPGTRDGGTDPADRIAQLTRWVPIDVTGGNNEVDCAIAEAINAADVLRHVQSIGTPAAMAQATVNQSVRKSGRTTQLTTGTVLSDNATTRVNYGGTGQGIFINQLQCTLMSQPGDSGSLIWDQNSLTVLGMVFAGNATHTFGNKILRVVQLLSRAFTVYDMKGKKTDFEQVDISLLDQA